MYPEKHYVWITKGELQRIIDEYQNVIDWLGDCYNSMYDRDGTFADTVASDVVGEAQSYAMSRMVELQEVLKEKW